MPGSRKGERRGGANPNRVKKATAPAKPRKPRPAVTQPRVSAATPAAAVDAAIQVQVNSQRKLNRERERQLYYLATGEYRRQPKDVMRSAMAYFEGCALDWMAAARQNMELEAEAMQAKSYDEARLYAQASETSENKAREYVMMTVDVAFKLAPFEHPKFSAMVLANPADTPINAIAELFREIQDLPTNRPRYIDHDPAEKPIAREPAE